MLLLLLWVLLCEGQRDVVGVVVGEKVKRLCVSKRLCVGRCLWRLDGWEED